ncbi:MAG: hypothetical protein WB660_02475 [Candidatus Sulfotelmatobacter sp.]
MRFVTFRRTRNLNQSRGIASRSIGATQAQCFIEDQTQEIFQVRKRATLHLWILPVYVIDHTLRG